MINQLTDGHVIKTMMKEHEHTLIILDELEELGMTFTLAFAEKTVHS